MKAKYFGIFKRSCERAHLLVAYGHPNEFSTSWSDAITI